MDGAPIKGETIPIRLFLGGYELGPTFQGISHSLEWSTSSINTFVEINKKFSVRYYLNLVLVDEDNRRYFKQHEIFMYRKWISPDGFIVVIVIHHPHCLCVCVCVYVLLSWDVIYILQIVAQKILLYKFLVNWVNSLFDLWVSKITKVQMMYYLSLRYFIYFHLNATCSCRDGLSTCSEL